MKKKNLLIFLFLIQTIVLPAQTWDGSSSTDWNTAANWTPATVPGAGSTVTIPNTVNKPVLASDVTIASISMASGSTLDFNSFTLTVNGGFDLAGATLNNTNAASDIVINMTSNVSGYFGGTVVNDNITINRDGTGIFYEGYQGGDTYNGNTVFNITGTGAVNMCYHQPSSFNGNLTITRSGIGITNIFEQGFTALTGNLSYTNAAGGNTSINGNNRLSAAIGGTVNITATGAGNPAFTMNKIKNLATGGTISVQNSGLVTIDDDTLTLSALHVNGFTGSGADEFRRNSITGNVSFSDDAANTGSTYIGGNIIAGNTTFTSNTAGIWYEGYQEADTYNGNTVFNITGTGAVNMCYHQPSSFPGNLAITRSGIGITNIFEQGFAALTGNFSYTNAAGGNTSINGNNKLSAAIGGTVNVTATGAGNPAFTMNKIKNLTTGGTLSVQNSGLVTIDDDTLTLSALNVNGFTGSGADEFRRNSITGNVSFSDDAANTGSTYIGGNIIAGNTTFTSNTAGIWYEGYQEADTYNGNTVFNITGTGAVNMCYHQPSSFPGNLAITRSGIGITNIFEQGFAALTGNFSYTNAAGGNTSINGNSRLSAAIGGTVNITATGAGNPAFTMNKIKNLTTGGTVSVQNSGLATIDDDTLTLSALNVNGFTGSGADEFRRNSITGNVTFSDDAANTGSVYTGENIIVGNAAYTSNAGNIWYESYQGSDIYNGNASFNRVAGTINLAYHDTTYANQDFIFNAASGIIIGNAVQFGGGNDGIIEQLGTQPIILPRLIMNKTSGATLILNDSVTVSTSAGFISGNIISSNTNYLSFLSNATHTGASDASHVNGLVKKTGNDAFTFPVGSSNGLHSVAITAPGVVTDVFSAQYFSVNPDTDGYDTSMRAGTLQRISGCEYWDVKRENGTSNEALTFSFGDPCPRSSVYITDPSAVNIAHWTGSTWEDLGNGGSTGTTSGTVSTAGNVSNFSPFTFGTSNALANPLPVHLVMFTANKQREAVSLQWKTENLVNFSHFEIERSKGDNHFVSIGIIYANSNPALLQYSFRDETPGKGINFYRLKLVDINGNFTYSKIAPILFSNSSAISIYPNPVKDEITILSSKNIISIEISDVSGRMIKRMTVSASNRYTVNDLQQGIYFIKVRDEEKITVSKLLVQ